MVIKLVVDTRRPNADGKYPLKISFANMGKTTLIKLNIYIHEYEHDNQNQILYTTDKNTKVEYQRHNSYIIKRSV